MMELGNDYYLAWMIYLVGALVSQFIVWRITAQIKAIEVRTIIQICSFAILITPVRLDPAQNYWVPALIAGLMDGLNDGIDALIERFVPVIVVMIGMLVISLIWKLSRRKNKRH
ncbi:MAG: hypothetical protein ACI92E_002160 [Oceanicoccus sp.]|jgi:hypothetical protein